MSTTIKTILAIATFVAITIIILVAINNGLNRMTESDCVNGVQLACKYLDEKGK